MELKINLEDKYDVVKLFQLLGNKKKEYVNDNYRHIEMIELLEGNDNNKKAQGRLEHEKHCMRMNNEHIEFIDRVMSQLEPIVDEYFNNR